MVLVALLAAHDLTHLFDNGLDTSASQLALVATPQWIAVAVVVAVILRAAPVRSGIAALLFGAGAAVGFALVHLVPFAPAEYWDLSPSTISWALVWIPTAVGVYVAALARRALEAGRAPGQISAIA